MTAKKTIPLAALLCAVSGCRSTVPIQGDTAVHLQPARPPLTQKTSSFTSETAKSANIPPAEPGAPRLSSSTAGDSLKEEVYAPVYPSPYFPVSDGSKWTYDSNIGKYTAVLSSLENPGEFLYVTRVKGSVAKASLVITDKAVSTRKQKTTIYLFSEETSYDPYLIRYPLPLIPGREFSWEGFKLRGSKRLRSSIKGKISEDFEEITVPAGVFKCLKISAELVSEDGTQNFTQWLSPGKGMVRMESTMDGRRTGVMGTLQKVFKIRKLTLELREYIPGGNK